MTSLNVSSGVQATTQEISGEPTIETVNGQDTLLKNLSQNFKNDRFSDITLVVANKRYPAHKTILATSSTYFLNMFYGGEWKEDKGDDVQLEEIPDCQDVFETFLKYFYTGTVSITKKTVVPVVMLADKYDVGGLKETCMRYMKGVLYSKVDIAAALGWLEFAEQMSMHALLKRCYDLVCFNFEKASGLVGWASLSLEHILVVLRRSDIVVSSEYAVYLAAQTWLKSQENVTPKEVDTILNNIQFRNIAAQDLCQVEESPLATNTICKTDNLLRSYLFDAYRYIALNEKYPEGICDATNFKRYYTAGSLTQLSCVKYFGRKFIYAALQPKCSWSEEPKKYTWEFGQFGISNQYEIRLPKVKRSGQDGYTCYLYNSLPGTYTLKVTLIFRNKDGNVLYIHNDFSEIQIPKKAQALMQFPEPPELSSTDYNPKNIPRDVLYSFTIEKV